MPWKWTVYQKPNANVVSLQLMMMPSSEVIRPTVTVTQRIRGLFQSSSCDIISKSFQTLPKLLLWQQICRVMFCKLLVSFSPVKNLTKVGWNFRGKSITQYEAFPQIWSLQKEWQLCGTGYLAQKWISQSKRCALLRDRWGCPWHSSWIWGSDTELTWDLFGSDLNVLLNFRCKWINGMIALCVFVAT